MRCRKAHWFLSARCDDTLSEGQRLELAAHLEECPSCRREAFYFSEIRGQTGNLEKIHTRADFNLRLKAKITAWEAEVEKSATSRPTIWSRLREIPGRLRDYAPDFDAIMIGPKRYALIGVLPVMLVLVVGVGYISEDSQFDTQLGSTEYITAQQEIAAYPAFAIDDHRVPGLPEYARQNQQYVLSGISLVDDISSRTQPKYVMPTVPAEMVTARAIF